MAGTIAVLFFLARVIITIHIKVFLFLIKHFDITNGLIVSLFVHLFTQGIQVNIWIRVMTLLIIVVGVVILQHLFKPARIAFGFVSSFFSGVITYGLFRENAFFPPVIPMVIAILATFTLNIVFWEHLKKRKQI